LQNQLQQAQQQLQQAQSKIESLNEAKPQIEREKNQMQFQLDDYKNKTDRSFKETQAENDTKRTEIELM
jgi:TolA-binding protein